MSNLYTRVFTGFYTHRKTLRLRAAIGDAAFWVPPRLWAYAVESKPDGDFSDFTADEIASLIGYTGDATKMLEALIKVGFMDAKPLRIHDWDEHNSYHKIYAERAQKAAAARWAKRVSESAPVDTGNDKDKDRGVSIATSNATSIPPVLTPTERITLERSLTRATAELKNLGSHRDYEKGSDSYNRVLDLKNNIIPEARKRLGVKA